VYLKVRYLGALAAAWTLADLAGHTSAGLDEVSAALSFRQAGASR
jgi:magnesium chelatase family protein